MVQFLPLYLAPTDQHTVGCVGGTRKLVATFKFQMTRAIGDSTVTAPDGSLINPSLLVSNRVVAKNAELELLINDWQDTFYPPMPGIDITFKVNGHDLPPGLKSTRTQDQSRIHKLPFPVEFLLFPQKASPQPVEREDTIEVYWNPQHFAAPQGSLRCGADTRRYA